MPVIPATQKAEAGGLLGLRVQDQTGKHVEFPFYKKTKSSQAW